MQRRRYERPAGGTEAPVDDLLDLAHQSVSLAVREMGARIGIDSGSFTRAAANLERVGQLKVSDEMLRQIVESDGQAVLAWQEQEQLALDFDAGICRTQATQDGQARTRVYVGIDGFMLPMVTEGEAFKRYEKAKSRRKKLKRKRGVRRPALVRRHGADQRYKEFKLVAFYDQELEHKLLRVTRQGPEKAAKMLRAMAEDVHLYRAREIVAVTDGAAWIAGLIERNLPAEKTTAILDFYHAAEHVHATRRVVFGEQNPAGQVWAGKLLKGLLEGTYESWWGVLVETRGRVRAAGKRQSLDALMHYLLTRREQVTYARFRSLGLKIGSGPTESGCKSEARRLKGVGMRWTARNAEAVLALESLHQSKLWPTYWQSRLKAA